MNEWVAGLANLAKHALQKIVIRVKYIMGFANFYTTRNMQ